MSFRSEGVFGTAQRQISGVAAFGAKAYSMILGSRIAKFVLREAKEENLKCSHLCKLEGAQQAL